jgi:hypothetical protein
MSRPACPSACSISLVSRLELGAATGAASPELFATFRKWSLRAFRTLAELLGPREPMVRDG